jgi:hypothetical protein
VRLRTITTVALALGAGLAAGCGADDEGQPLPETSATELLGQLQSIQDRFEAGADACPDITEGDDTNVAVVQRTLDSLPERVDADVREAVSQGFDRLFELVEQECAAEQDQTETDTTPVEPTTPTTDTTDTTDTTETTTETEPTTPTTDTTETVPPDTGEEPPPEVPPGQGGENPGQGNGGGVIGPEDGE